MAIKRLKAETKNSRLQVIYRLWKGSKKPANGKGSGRDLKEQYRFEGYSRGVEALFSQFYSSTNLAENIRIYLPFDKPDDVFDPSYIEYDQKRGLVTKCDGEFITEKRVNGADGKSYMTPCNDPCRRSPDRNYCGTCKHSGKFFFYIREMVEAGSGFGAGGMMALSGMHDVEGLYHQLCVLHDKYGSLKTAPMPSPLTFGMIPYVLSRVKTPFQRKDDKGSGEYTVNTHYYATTIAEDPEFMKDLLLYRRRDEFLSMMEDPRTLSLPGVAEKFGIDRSEIPQLVASRETVDLSSYVKPIANEPEPVQVDVYDDDYEPELTSEPEPELEPGLEPEPETQVYNKDVHLRETWVAVRKMGLNQVGLKNYLDRCNVDDSHKLSEGQINALREMCQDKDVVTDLNTVVNTATKK